jgi:putative peptide zinc metalloprotease protein
MSATTARPAARFERPTTPPLARAEGVELLGDLPGSGYKAGAALVRRADGQMVQLGPLQYSALEAIDGTCDGPAIAAAMSERLGRRVAVEHVARIAQKLAAQGLLAGSEANAPPKRNPLLALRWKVLVTDEAITRRLTAPFMWLFRPWVMAPVLVAFAGVCWFVLIHKGIASAAAQAINRPELLLLVFVLGIASAGFHEIGHASACRYGGATPGGIGMGIYMVWPAFYTDVTDAYRLPKRARLRVDLGGLYFNAVVAVVTTGVWLAVRVDALLLLVGLQLLEMVKQLSPVIRADGYHILADATGVPDLFAHIGPTLRHLIPGREREPSALTGRARVLVTVWVLVVVPVLLSLMLSALLLFPRIVTTAWDSGRVIASAIPHESVLDVLASIVRLFALCLPVLGTALISQRIVRGLVGRAQAWSSGNPVRRTLVLAAGAAVLAAAAWAWWPSGQYQPIRATDSGTLPSMVRLVSSPASVARPQPRFSLPPRVHLAPGKHLAVAMIPVGGATKRHPAFFMIKDGHGRPPAMIVSTSAPDPATAPSATGTTPTSTTTTTAPTTTSSPAPTSATVPAAAFAFKLPTAPGPGDSQALAVNHTDGGVKYDIAYSVLTVKDGAPVLNNNSAWAFANCKACTTVAVSFQVVLVIGQSNLIAPMDIAGALNVDCPACVTMAIADQIVVTLKSMPSDEVLAHLQADLQQLNGISSLGSAQDIANEVAEVQHEVEVELVNSGLVANQQSSSTTTTAGSSSSGTTSTTPTSTTPTSTATTPTSSTSQPATTTPTSTTPAATDTTQTTSTAPTQTTTTDTTATTTTPTDTTTTPAP